MKLTSSVCIGLVSLGLGWYAICAGTLAARKVPEGDEVDLLMTNVALHERGVTTFRYDFMSAEMHGNWHPPGWWLVLQVVMAWGIDAFEAALLVNALCITGSLGCTWSLSRSLTNLEGQHNSFLEATTAVCLLCAIPLYQAAATIVDIDNSVLTLGMSAYIAILFHELSRMTQRTRQIWQDLGFGALFGLNLLCKISTPWILLPVTCATLRIATGRWGTAIGRTGRIGALGIILFVSVFAATRPLFGGRWYEPFLHNFAKATGGDLETRWYGFIRTMVELALWVGPAALLVPFVSAVRTSTVWAGRRPTCRWVLTAYVLCIWGTYGFMGVTFNLRYMVPTLPILAVLGGAALWDGLRGSVKISWRRAAGLFTVATWAASLAVVLLPEPLLFLKEQLRVQIWPAAGSYALRFLIIIVMCSSVWLFWPVRSRAAVAWLLVALVAVNVNTSFKQSKGGYGVGYAYGSSGYDALVKWIRTRTHVGPDAIILGPESVLWLLREDHFETYHYLNVQTVMRNVGDSRGNRDVFVVNPRNRSQLTQVQLQLLDRLGKVVARHGSFDVIQVTSFGEHHVGWKDRKCLCHPGETDGV